MPKPERIGINVTHSMAVALKSEAERRGATLSNLMRLILVEYLRNAGYEVDSTIRWGGDRHAPPE